MEKTGSCKFLDSAKLFVVVGELVEGNFEDEEKDPIVHCRECMTGEYPTFKNGDNLSYEGYLKCCKCGRKIVECSPEPYRFINRPWKTKVPVCSE